MQSSSDRFAEAIGGGYTLATSVLVRDPDGNVTPLEVTGGSVTLDGNAATRATLSLDVVSDVSLVPTDASALLAPYGNVILPSRGISFADIDEEIPLGAFFIDTTTVEDTGGDLQIQVSGFDFSQRVIEKQMLATGQIPAATACDDAIEPLVTQALPTMDIDFDFATAMGEVTLPLLNYSIGDDRWDLCQGIAEAAQCDLYFDSLGACTATPHPVIESPNLVVAEEEVLISASRILGRQDFYNAVAVFVDNSGQDPVVGWAQDDDPASPTAWGGDAGDRVFEWHTEYITGATESDIKDQADAVASTILSKKRGITSQLTFDSLVDPRLRPFDVVQVKRERLGINDLYIVDSVTIPLDGAQMTCQTRAVQVQQ